MADKPKTRGLGRGLSALMSDVGPEPGVPDRPRRPDQQVPVEQVHPNPDQPRRSFRPEALEDLAASIKEKGIIQPLIVRPDPNREGHYQIVAGERRWRAAQMAQLHELPVLVRAYSDTEMLEVAIIENIQRSDLNAIDEAAGYQQLMDRFGHTQDQLGSALGKSRSHIANMMRLLTLPDSIQQYVVDGKLTSGHARTLVGHPEAESLAAEIIRKKLSVREAEKLAKKPDSKPAKSQAKVRTKDADTVQLERELAAALGVGVTITQKGEGGELSLRYRDLEQLDDLLRMLSGG